MTIASIRRRLSRSAPGLLVAACGALLLSSPSASAAGPPLITNTGFSAVTETAATLEARVDPNGAKVKDFHFDYIPLTAYEADGNSFGEGTLSTPVGTLPATVEGTGDLIIGSKTLANLSTSAGTFAAGQSITGPGIPAATTITEAGATSLTLSAAATATSAGATITATGPQPVAAAVTGLTPATAYRFRLYAKSNQGELFSPAFTFYTYSEAPVFGPCPNEIFRSGEFAPLGHPSALLPDCRAYEQVSPVDKNGNDALGEVGFSRAATDGSAATFIATSGIPGAEGAQQMPTYVGTRGEAGWSTTGLSPQATAGPRARLLGWTPDFSATVTQASRQTAHTLEGALYIRTDPAAPAIQASAYAPMSGNITFGFAGASADGKTIAFEVPVALPPKEGQPPIAAAQPEAPNVYAYDAATGLVSLVSVMNTQPETEAALRRGGFAGSEGGSVSAAYTQDTHAVAADGSVFFTASATGQLYERVNPSATQSELDSEGNCTQPAKACTIQISRSERTPPDPAGPQPAAFQAASADGSEAFFTSSEKLTNDANTGPVQPPAQIGRANLGDPDPNASKKEDFLPTHALGLTTDPKGEYIYWVDPLKGTIGRAKLNGAGNPTNLEPEYIVPGETKAITMPQSEPGMFHFAPSTPRYIAVDEEHVYWTNTGPLAGESTGSPFYIQLGKPLPGGGTIGRATIGATKAEDIRPEFVVGASDPQGIAVDSEHIYWGNAEPAAVASSPTIARAPISGEAAGVEEEFFKAGQGQEPMGVAVTSEFIYFGLSIKNGDFGFVSRIPIGGGEEEFFGAGGEGMRGLAINGAFLYWATQEQGEEAIGRIPIADFPKLGGCSGVATCKENYLTPSGLPFGLATHGSHLYWSVNGETPPNPGNDLYRYSAAPDSEGHHLTDLTPDSADPNGADVIGVLGTSADGSYVYFIANADLDEAGAGFQGNCHGATLVAVSGRCDLYLSHEGQISFVAPLRPAGPLFSSDISNVLPRASGLEGGDSAINEKTSYVAAEGAVVFRSVEDQGSDETHGVPQYFRFAPGQGLACLSCNPTGGPSVRPKVEVNLGAPGMAAFNPDSTMPHPLSAGGNRFFFQTAAGLVAADTNGQGGPCPTWNSGTVSVPSCQDVYEWEAPGSGSCKEAGPAYSPLNQGCLYLLSSGVGTEPAFFSDASADGSSVFLFTREQLVGQDGDDLIDLYAARADGGLAAQNPVSEPECEAEGCKPAVTPVPSTPSPETPAFVGPGNRKPTRCPKGKVLRKGKCQKKKKHGHRSHAKQTGGQR